MLPVLFQLSLPGWSNAVLNPDMSVCAGTRLVLRIGDPEDIFGFGLFPKREFDHVI